MSGMSKASWNRQCKNGTLVCLEAKSSSFSLVVLVSGRAEGEQVDVLTREVGLLLMGCVAQ